MPALGEQMTPDERDRLKAVEMEVKGLRELLGPMAADLAEIKAAAHMGRGAWLLLLKLGGVLGAVAMVVAWAIDHLPGKH